MNYDSQRAFANIASTILPTISLEQKLQHHFFEVAFVSYHASMHTFIDWMQVLLHSQKLITL